MLFRSLEINKEEAKSASLFVAGWRPAVGWCCSLALAYQFLVRPISTGFGHEMPAIDVEALSTLLFALLGVAGLRTVEKIKGIAVEPINYNNIPGCTYCQPEIASVGYTEKKAKEAGYQIKVGKFPFSASGKAKASGTSDGFIKLIFDAKYGELLGAHMIGANVTEMIAEIVALRKLETTGHDLIKTVHPHPTMSEAIMEAAAAAYGEVIHL